MKKAKKAAKMFLLVIDKKKNRVLKFWLGSDLLDKRHLARILKKIETLEKRYPLPLYEVVFGTAPDADAEAVKIKRSPFNKRACFSDLMGEKRRRAVEVN